MALKKAMHTDFLPYKEMEKIFLIHTERDPVIWAIATNSIWLLRLAFNSGLRKADLNKDHWAVAFYKADRAMILEMLFIIQHKDVYDVQGVYINTFQSSLKLNKYI